MKNLFFLLVLFSCNEPSKDEPKTDSRKKGEIVINIEGGNGNNVSVVNSDTTINISDSTNN
jgi:hypothetical protein